MSLSITRPRHLPPFLFLEQSFRAENIPGNDLELMAQCQQAVGPGRFGVKPHPGTGDHLLQALGLSRKVGLSVPWELFLLNQEPPRPTVLTVCSNGPSAAGCAWGLEDDTVMLYKLYTGKVLWKETRCSPGIWRRSGASLPGGITMCRRPCSSCGTY